MIKYLKDRWHEKNTRNWAIAGIIIATILFIFAPRWLVIAVITKEVFQFLKPETK